MRKGFYLALIIIYILFISKDMILGIFRTDDKIIYTNTDYYKEEYEKLNKLLEIDNSKYNLIYTKLILRDIYEFYDTITINKGSKSGVKKGNIVVNNEGLIGIVGEVNYNYSKVELLTNAKINLSVKINDAYGILTSEAPKLIVKNIKGNRDLKIGDKVYTSGLTETLEGVLVGEVVNVLKDDLGLEYKIEVKPAANFLNLKYLGVSI